MPKATTLPVRHVNLTAIQFDSATQVRAEIDNDTVAEYAAAMAEGEEFPPATLFQGGHQFWIGDGWHRLLAAQANGVVTFPCSIDVGGRTAAIRFALSANARHGRPRTNADKRKAVSVALREYPNLSNRELGKICAVSHVTVAEHRGQLDNSSSSTHRLGGDGKLRPATQRLKEPQLQPEPPDDPDAPIQPDAEHSESVDVTPHSSPDAPPPAPPAPPEPAPYSLPKRHDAISSFVERELAETPAEHLADIKRIFRDVIAARCAATATDPTPKPWGDKKVIPPMPEWVTVYSASIGYPMDGEKWCDQYAVKGWAVGKTKMKDWQSAVRNWKTNGWGLGSVTLAGASKSGKASTYDKF